ncbi:hypothetical protein Tco_0404512 [Tanacetum coccineum]
MTNSHQQSTADDGSKNRPPMFEKGSYVPLESHFIRYIDGKKAYGKILKDSITNSPYMSDPIVQPHKRLQKEKDLEGNGHAGKTNVLTAENISALNYGFWGKRCEKNYLSVRRYVADPDNAYPKRSITKLILKGAVIFDVVSYQFRCALNYSKLLLKLLNQEYVARIRGKLIQKLLLNQKCMGYLVRAYYSISPTKYYKDDSCWSADLKSNTTEDVISI